MIWTEQSCSAEVRTVVDAEDAHKGLSTDVGVLARKLSRNLAPPKRSGKEGGVGSGFKPIAASCCVLHFAEALLRMSQLRLPLST